MKKHHFFVFFLGMALFLTEIKAQCPVTILANPPSLCPGGTATLTASAATTWTWSANAGAATTNSVAVTPITTTVYTVSATTGTCTATQTVSILVSPTPTTTIAPPVGTTTLFCTGTPYQFIGNSNPGPVLFYQWHSSPFVVGITPVMTNSACTNCNGPVVTFYNIGVDTLTLIINNSSGCIDSVKYPVSVAVTPTVTTGPGAPPPHICLGGTGITLYAYGATTYTWTPLTSLTPYGTGDSAAVNPPILGVYTYSVTGTIGSCNSLPVAITVTVDPVPIPTFVINPDSICSGGSATLFVYGLPAGTGSLTTTYTWTAAPNAGLGTNSGSSAAVTPYYYGVVDSTFNYVVSMTVPGCPPFASYTLSVVVVPTPTITMVSDTVENCNKMGDSLEVTCIPSSGVTFIWTPTGYMTPGSGLGNPVFVNPTTTATVTYYCTPVSTQLGCVGKRDSVKVLIGDTTNAEIISQYYIICSGMQDTLFAMPQWTALNNTYQYYWSGGPGILSVTGDTFIVSPPGLTIYTLTVKGTCVKNKQATVTVAVNTCYPVVATYSTTADTICVNKCVWYTDLTQNYTVKPLFYMWVFPGGTVYNPCVGCTISPTRDTVWFVAADSNAIPQIKVCYRVNSSINFGGVYPVFDNVSHSPGGPYSTATGQIKVDQGPLANAGINPTIDLGNYAQLNGANSTGNLAIVSYVWTPPDSLTCNNCPKPQANPSQTTQYFLTVTDVNGCTSIDSMTVFVEIKCYDPFIPTAFSPNGDLMNDILYVRSNCLTNFLFRVFDRWGEKVFETSNLLEGWDGAYRGQALNAGVFVFTLEGFQTITGGGEGKQVKQKGTITLVR